MLRCLLSGDAQLNEGCNYGQLLYTCLLPTRRACPGVGTQCCLGWHGSIQKCPLRKSGDVPAWAAQEGGSPSVEVLMECGDVALKDTV